MDILVILNDSPYGTERSYNGLRLALSLAKAPEVELCVFLMADAVRCAQRGQRTPAGFYNIERMLTGLRVKGVLRSSMAELTAWTLAVDKVVSF